MLQLGEECALSFYREITALNEAHGVMLVQHRTSGRIFVKKTLTVYDPAVFRYLKEHPVPHTPRIYEAAEDGGTLTVIEEYISGVTLQELLDEHGTLPEAQAVEIARQLCGVLCRLHGAPTPIIHRDIKPSNVMVAWDGSVTLLDMDAAKCPHDGAERDTRLIGTRGYAAPEQYGFGASGVQTDIYALGVLLNVMLTGQLPQSGMAKGRPGAVVEKCTRMEQERRYRSASDVQRELCRLGAPSEYRPWKSSWLPPGFRTRNPLRMVAAAAGYLFLFACVFSLDPGGDSIGVVLLNRVVLGAAFLLIILLSADYRDCWNTIGVAQAPKPLRPWLIVALDAGILLLGIALTDLLEPIFR